MYGLKEAIIIAYKRLVRNLQPHGYAPVAHTPDLWTHTTLSTTFTLAVEDFGIKLFAADDATHLLNSLRKKYSITVNRQPIWQQVLSTIKANMKIGRASC